MKAEILGTQLAVGATMLATQTPVCVGAHFWDDPQFKTAVVMLAVAFATYAAGWLREKTTRRDRRAGDVRKP